MIEKLGSFLIILTLILFELTMFIQAKYMITKCFIGLVTIVAVIYFVHLEFKGVGK